MYELHHEHRPPVIIRINGLDEESQLTVGRNVCCQDESTFEEIHRYLKLNPSLFHILHIPVYCHLVWVLLRDSCRVGASGQLKIDNITSLFLMTLQKYLRSNHLRGLDRHLRKEVIVNLAKLAYNGIKDSRIIFKGTHLEECGISFDQNGLVRYVRCMENREKNMTMLYAILFWSMV